MIIPLANRLRRQQRSSAPLVTVGVTSFQDEAVIARCLTSLVQQSLPAERIEVLVVDDGSADGTVKVAKTFAEQAPWAGFEVQSHPPTGSPSTGRQRVVDSARGAYAFFLDADDYLGAEALQAMTAAARRGRADIVTGRYVGVNRSAPNILTPKRTIDGEGYHAGWLNSLHVQKLFRTEFLRGLPYRFNESLRYASDHPFMISAFLHAGRTARVDDVDCYFITLEQPDAQATSTAAATTPLSAWTRRGHVSRAELSAAQQLKFLHDCFGILALGRGQGGELGTRAGRMRADYWNRLLKLHIPQLILRKTDDDAVTDLASQAARLAELYGAETSHAQLVPGAQQMLLGLRSGGATEARNMAEQVRADAAATATDLVQERETL